MEQEKKDTREGVITIRGRGDLKVKPDVTRVTLKLTTMHDTYREAYEQGKEDSAKLADVMRDTGLDPELAKTRAFDIEKKTSRQYDSHKNYIGDKFLGFELNHEVKIDLGMDNDVLHKLLSRVGEKLKQAEADIDYTVKDPRPVEMELLERAVKDSKEKAELIVRTCGCSLGMVREISYDVPHIDIYHHDRTVRHDDMFDRCAELSIGSPVELNPDDIDTSISVNIEWSVRQWTE